jgi:uncharacterized membrane protein (UPF0182 family)
VIGGLWGLAQWETALKYLNRASTGITDPLFGQDTGFYLFGLPFYDALYSLFVLLTLVVLAVGAFASFLRIRKGQVEIVRHEQETTEEADRRLRPVRDGVVVLLVVFACGRALDCFHLMFSEWGAVTGPGWTDVHVRLPAYLLMAGLCLVVALALVASPARSRMLHLLGNRNLAPEQAQLALMGGSGVLLLAAWFLALQAAPGAF